MSKAERNLKAALRESMRLNGDEFKKKPPVQWGFILPSAFVFFILTAVVAASLFGRKVMAAVPPPQTVEVGFIAALTILVGPQLGEYALILFGALIGTMHSVSKMDFNGDKLKATMYMLRWIGAAVVLTSFVASLIKTYAGFPADRWPGVVAFGLTFLADKWPTWVSEAGAAWVRMRTPSTPKE